MSNVLDIDINYEDNQMYCDEKDDDHVVPTPMKQINPPSLPERKADFYLSKERLLNEFPNHTLALVDIQFVAQKVVEICIAGPSSCVLFHRIYSAPKRTYMNEFVRAHNIKYTGAFTEKDLQRRDEIFDDSNIFCCMPKDVIFVIRGGNKLKELQKRLKMSGRPFEPKIFTFPEKFHKEVRPCDSHAYRHNVMCTVANVAQMCRYYGVYQYMFNQKWTC